MRLPVRRPQPCCHYSGCEERRLGHEPRSGVQAGQLLPHRLQAGHGYGAVGSRLDIQLSPVDGRPPVHPPTFLCAALTCAQNGGLYCDKDGSIKKPFPNKPNCVQGTGAVKAVNKCKSQMSWCQTVLPGNEAMLIPTLVDSEATIAVPNTDYWCSTAAQYDGPYLLLRSPPLTVTTASTSTLPALAPRAASGVTRAPPLATGVRLSRVPIPIPMARHLSSSAGTQSGSLPV